MQSLRSGFGVISAILPIVYFGGLLYYFLDQAGSLQEAENMGLGPTLLGLGIVGLLFCIPLIYRIVRLIMGPGSRGSDGSGGGPDASGSDEKGGFDADAVVARYMAQRSAEASAPQTTLTAAPEQRRPSGRPGFGRKTR